MRAKPFIKWAGGKAKNWNDSLQFLMHQGKINCYYEPFAGGAAVFYQVDSQKAVLNDFNRKLMSTYNAIKINPDMVIYQLELLQKEYDRSSITQRKALYYRLRTKFNEAQFFNKYTPQYVAAIFIFLNKVGFNGVYRENKDGGFNIPCGDARDKNLYDFNNIMAVSEHLKHTTLYSGDFEYPFINIRPGKGDFAFLDPPYIPVNATSFTTYNGDGFGKWDQERLVNLCHDLDEAGVRWMACNSSAPLAKDLYAHWAETSYLVQEARSVNSDKNGRGKVFELIVTNYPIDETVNPEFAKSALLQGLSN